VGIPQAQIDKPFDKLSAHPNRHWLWAIALAAIAFAFRLIPVLRGGGLFGFGNYDDGVYYAAATGLVHGRLPYLDFLLLHPPGMPLLLTPFALGAQLASDSYGFAAARLAWMLLGALNAVLIWRILRPIGLVAALLRLKRLAAEQAFGRCRALRCGFGGCGALGRRTGLRCWLGRCKRLVVTKDDSTIIEGYGDRYIVPTRSLLDDLASDFGHTEAGQRLADAYRRADDRGMRDRHDPAAARTERFQPPSHPDDQPDDRLSAVRGSSRVGQPDRQLVGWYAAEHVAAPRPTVEIG